MDFPSSSQYVTGIGGTEFPAADVAPTNTTYWESANKTDIIGSAKSYIPEQVWNDDSSSGGLSAGGGGASSLTARPSWQTGVPGIPAGNFPLAAGYRAYGFSEQCRLFVPLERQQRHGYHRQLRERISRQQRCRI